MTTRAIPCEFLLWRYDVIPVILSGGSGTRLWPVSRRKFPKQFCNLFDEPLQIQTLKRLSNYGTPWIITSLELREFTEKKAKEAGFQAHVIYEPTGKNTAPAIAMLCKILELKGKKSEVVGVFPADHLVGKPDIFLSALDLAEAVARDRKIVTLGVKPTEPATGYGYIQTESQPYSYKKKLASYSVLKFHEKPTLELAKDFLRDGHYYWNAGIFVFTVDVMIELFEKYQPQIWDVISTLKKDLSNLRDIYSQLSVISIDYAILEKLNAQELACVPCDPDWSDVGSWDAVAEVYERNGKSRGDPIEVDSKNNFVLPMQDKKYAFVGVDDLIVVDTEDALLIAKKGETQNVKSVVERISQSHPKLISEHVFEERPWGRFEILRDRPHFKSKFISVNPGQQISYQSHAKREEHWVVVGGEGELILDGKHSQVEVGSTIKIPQGTKHRIRNTGRQALEFIEVQLGSYFGEDDITRFEDDYNRI